MVGIDEKKLKNIRGYEGRTRLLLWWFSIRGLIAGKRRGDEGVAPLVFAHHEEKEMVEVLGSANICLSLLDLIPLARFFPLRAYILLFEMRTADRLVFGISRETFRIVELESVDKISAITQSLPLMYTSDQERSLPAPTGSVSRTFLPAGYTDGQSHVTESFLYYMVSRVCPQ